MKRFIIPLVFTCFIYSCNEPPEFFEDNNETPQTDTRNAQIESALEVLGIYNYQIVGNYVIIDNDMAIHKDQVLTKIEKAGSIKQSDAITQDNYHINVRVKNSATAQVDMDSNGTPETTLLTLEHWTAAFDAWANISDSGLSFTIDPETNSTVNDNDIHITVYGDIDPSINPNGANPVPNTATLFDLNTAFSTRQQWFNIPDSSPDKKITCGRGMFPNGKPGPGLSIDLVGLSLFGNTTTSIPSDEKILTLLSHEIGHNLGFLHHNETTSLVHTTEHNICGTDFPDENSIMFSDPCGKVLPFTSGDEVGLLKLYPKEYLTPDISLTEDESFQVSGVDRYILKIGNLDQNAYWLEVNTVYWFNPRSIRPCDYDVYEEKLGEGAALDGGDDCVDPGDEYYIYVNQLDSQTCWEVNPGFQLDAKVVFKNLRKDRTTSSTISLELPYNRCCGKVWIEPKKE